MQKVLQDLIKLQELDLAIAELERLAGDIPGQIKALEEALAASRASLDRARAEGDATHKLRRSQEQVLEEVVLEQRKKQARLYEIKTNQEYSAVLKEIEVLKERQGRVEEEILGLMEKGEGLAGEIRRLEGERTRAEARHREERARKEVELAEAQARLRDLQARWKVQARPIDPELLQTYRKLLRTRAGRAVVPALIGRRKVKSFGSHGEREETAASCGGCNVSLRPQFVNELRRGEELLTCASCSRILYAQP
jgi:predicted  nucleic acid-binding Zn-ribbon protein